MYAHKEREKKIWAEEKKNIISLLRSYGILFKIEQTKQTYPSFFFCYLFQPLKMESSEGSCQAKK